MIKSSITKHGTVIKYDVSPKGLPTVETMSVIIAISLWLVAFIGYLIVKAAM